MDAEESERGLKTQRGECNPSLSRTRERRNLSRSLGEVLDARWGGAGETRGKRVDKDSSFRFTTASDINHAAKLIEHPSAPRYRRRRSAHTRGRGNIFQITALKIDTKIKRR